MTDQVNIAPQSNTCNAVCWLLAIGLGGFLTLTLVRDFGQDQVQSAALGLVLMLVAGFVLRRMFCRAGGSRVERRIAEAAARANVDAAKAPAAPARLSETRVPDKAPAKPAASAKPVLEPETISIEEKIASNLAAAASAVGREMPLSDEAEAPETTPETDVDVDADIRGADVDDDHVTAKGAEAEDIDADIAQSPLKLVTPIAPESEDAATAEAPETPAAPEPEPKAAVEVATEQPDPAPKDTAAQTIKPAKPKMLESPENGAPDDLQRIDGIGETEESALFDAGIYHFAQFVGMNRRELAWLDQNITPDGPDGISAEWRKQAIAISRGAG